MHTDRRESIGYDSNEICGGCWAKLGVTNTLKSYGGITFRKDVLTSPKMAL